MDWLATFWELIRTPFLHVELIWGVVPLYFAWALNELTSDKASFQTALQTGFSFIWAAMQWTWLLVRHARVTEALLLESLVSVNGLVTLAVLGVGLLAFLSGLRKRYPRFCSFLGHARLGNYVMILIYPMQSNHLPWDWGRVETIALFAVPVWLICWLGFKPLRR